jgi:hypothetical protein
MWLLAIMEVSVQASNGSFRELGLLALWAAIAWGLPSRLRLTIRAIRAGKMASLRAQG